MYNFRKASPFNTTRGRGLLYDPSGNTGNTDHWCKDPHHGPVQK